MIIVAADDDMQIKRTISPAKTTVVALACMGDTD
jgi:hypothetical protein